MQLLLLATTIIPIGIILPPAESCASAAALPNNKFLIDERDSSVSAKVSFFGLTSKSAYFSHIRGHIELPQSLSGNANVDVTIDATSLRATDKITSERLKSPNFFDTTHYELIRFQGNTIHQLNKLTAEIKGNLTVKSITRPAVLTIHLKAPFPSDGTLAPVQIEGTMRINRYDFQINAYPLIVGREVFISISANCTPIQ